MPVSPNHVYTTENNGLVNTIDGFGFLNISNLNTFFYSRVPDVYDFIIVYTNVAKIATNHVWFNGLRNRVSGINRGIFGDEKRLLGIIDLAPYPEAGKYSNYPGEIHELGHQWLAYAGANQGLADGGHWRLEFQTGNDPLGGSSFLEQSKNIFVQVPSTSVNSVPGKYLQFHPLSLYLMGLIPSSQVTEIKLLIPSATPWLDTRYGVMWAGDFKNISIQEIISSVGPRIPAFPNTQKDFNVAFLLITPKGQPPTEEEIAAVNRAATEIPEFWYKATSRLSRINPTAQTAAVPRQQPESPQPTPPLVVEENNDWIAPVAIGASILLLSAKRK